MRLTISIAACLGAALLGSLLTRPALKPWYAGLAKPLWTPPNWLFGPAWTILFLAMAAAAWLVWRQSSLTSGPMQLFLLQLLLNVAWSAVFFHFRSPGAAFIEIIVLWCAILITTIAFKNIVPLAGWLMIPYLAWVTYAAALNFTIWRLNS
jgi:tryptophan-rich sensory protein